MAKWNKTRAILLNGPPSSGKDLSAIILRNMIDNKFPKTTSDITPYRVELIKFAGPLKMASHALLGIPQSTEFFEKELGNAWKDKESNLFFGKTPRSEYIALSEDFAKLRHGNDLFGRVAVRRMQISNIQNTFIFSDSGFVEEASPVIAHCGLDNTLVIELERPGCDFSNDSRGYIGAQLKQMYPGIRVQRLPNNGDQKQLTMLLMGAMMKYYDFDREL